MAAVTKVSFGVRMANRIKNRVDSITKFYNTKMPIVMKYASQELKPPSMAELPQLKKEIGQLVSKGSSGAWKELTTYQVVLNAVVVWEIFCWYCVGEIIGKRKISGYDAGYGSYAQGFVLMEPTVFPDDYSNFPLPQEKK